MEDVLPHTHDTRYPKNHHYSNNYNSSQRIWLYKLIEDALTYHGIRFKDSRSQKEQLPFIHQGIVIIITAIDMNSPLENDVRR